MNLFIIFAFLFSMGSIIGWGIEVLFRRFFSAKNWVNPGFLVGPWLPLYGVSLCTLYLLAHLESLLPISNPWIRKPLLFFLMAAVITAVEYAAGMIFIHGMKIQLWDYSERRGNIRGVICPAFSFFWALLSAVYYFFIHAHILSALQWLSENLAFSFAIGFFYGIFVIDLAYSSQAIVKIRAFAAEKDIVVRFEELKEEIRHTLIHRKKRHFFLFLHGNAPLLQHLEAYRKKHAIREKIRLTERKRKNAHTNASSKQDRSS